MKLFVEKQPYSSTEAKKILERFDPRYDKNGAVSTDYVGYTYDKQTQDCIFILPKVICDSDGKAFGLDPNDIIDVQNSKLTPEQKNFLGGLGVWTYRALCEFYSHNPESKAIKLGCFSKLGGSDNVNGTYLDVLLSIKAFYEENRDFFMFTMKNIHSQRHKTNWQRTISHSSAIFQDGIPVYLDPIGKKKEIDWDEELMTIYFSILEYMNRFGFGISADLNYSIIKGAMFEAYLEGMGVRRLRQIRHRYYSDKTRKLWSLCYSFFEKNEEIAASKQSSDYMMATSFHVIFESMVDTLIGDPQYDKLKDLEDGKIIDHLYKDRSVFTPDEIFYIVDSKYYEVGQGPKEKSESVFKQFSYARTIVNDEIRARMKETWPYRDKTTEGYVAMPNLFISAETDPDLRYDRDGFDSPANQCDNAFFFRVFANRLFDRDTLWVRQYNLNFLYLLSVYAAAEPMTKSAFNTKAREFFRRGTIDLLNLKYEFFVLTPKSGNLDYAMTDKIKWDLKGMCFRLGVDSEKLVLALEKPIRGNVTPSSSEQYCNMCINDDYNRIKPLVEATFNRTRCRLSYSDSEYFHPVDPSEGGFTFF